MILVVVPSSCILFKSKILNTRKKNGLAVTGPLTGSTMYVLCKYLKMAYDRTMGRRSDLTRNVVIDLLPRG